MIASAEIYDPALNRFTSAGNLAVARHSAQGLRLADGRVLVAAGSGDTTSGGTAAVASSEIYTPSATGAGAWATSAQVPALGTARRDFTLTDLGGGRALVAGGFNATGRLGLAELYAEALGAPGSFTATLPMLTPRAGHAATRLPNGRVLVTGGTGSSGTAIGTAETYGGP